jgi:hypothetical protein
MYAIRTFGALGAVGALASAAGPSCGPEWGREWEAGLLLTGGLVAAGALILEHRGHRYASVTLLVATALAGGVLAALRVYGRRAAAPAPTAPIS